MKSNKIHNKVQRENERHLLKNCQKKKLKNKGYEMHERIIMDMQTTKSNQKVQYDKILTWQQRL